MCYKSYIYWYFFNLIFFKVDLLNKSYKLTVEIIDINFDISPPWKHYKIAGHYKDTKPENWTLKVSTIPQSDGSDL